MIKFTDNAMTILKARYLRKNEEGTVVETPEEMLLRVAYHLAGNDNDQAAIFFRLMESLDFLPNTPTLINAGRADGQLSACFVLPVEDSMESIFTAVKNTALIHKTGGGTGFSFSRLRSKGQLVSTTGGESSGVISFMKVFDAATESVKQGGVRRGANMGLLRVDHPDIEEFIACKDDTSKLNNFNISVGITDKFMLAVTAGLKFQLIDPHTRKVTKVVKAKDLWNQIVHQAWKNGEPGLIFLDTVNKANPTPEYGDFEATNPCGEQPLLPFESCNLGSINLLNHVQNGLVDFDHLERTVKNAVDFLNAVLDHNCFPLPEIREATLRTRKIGLGVMGFADMLIKLGIRYDAKEADYLAYGIMHHILTVAIRHSKEKGYNNATITTIAPTGTISMLANVSGGIEPNFAWVYKRISCDQEMHVVHPLMEEKLREIGQFNSHILDQLVKGVSVSEIPELKDIGNYWQLSHEIDPVHHIQIQATFQRGTQNAVSKTINMPAKATERDVSDAYLMAYELGCKGVTVYRDGSRAGQVLSFEGTDEKLFADTPVFGDDYPCPECGTMLQRAEGCALCYNCGHSDCM